MSAADRPLRIGITCYPSIGGSGILATVLGIELAERGHEVHFISYERPVRLGKCVSERIHFHQVQINDYALFRYPDYTLPLSVKMAEVSRTHHLDILHVHYAVPHATAALLARCMLEPELQPKIVTTLHGTDTTLLGSDPGYGPAIHHALIESDAVTTVSEFLKDETRRVIGFDGPIEVIYNFYEPETPSCTKEEMRKGLGISDSELMILHTSNLRPVKRIDLLLEAVSKIDKKIPFKLVVVAGGNFEPFNAQVKDLEIEDRLIVKEMVPIIEDYVQAADLAIVSSQTESFCLTILEAMSFACPTVATDVGGIPEVVEDGKTGLLVPFGDTDELARKAETLLKDKSLRDQMGKSAQHRAKEKFLPARIVPQYVDLYRRVAQS